MASYLVLTPPGGPDADHARTRFLRDGFSFAGFLFPGLWLLSKRLWVFGVAALALQFLAGEIADRPGLFFAGTAIGLALSILVALEGPSLILNHLERKGWRLAGVVVADDLDTAEAIYFNDPATATAAPPPAIDWRAGPAPHGMAQLSHTALGLLDFNGGR